MEKEGWEGSFFRQKGGFSFQDRCFSMNLGHYHTDGVSQNKIVIILSVFFDENPLLN